MGEIVATLLLLTLTLVFGPTLIIVGLSLALTLLPVVLIAAMLVPVYWLVKHKKKSVKKIPLTSSIKKGVKLRRVPTIVYIVSTVITIFIMVVLIIGWLFWFPPWVIILTIIVVIAKCFIK